LRSRKLGSEFGGTAEIPDRMQKFALVQSATRISGQC
jgi:hypothetical protein